MNVFDDDWDDTPYPTPPGWEQRTKRLVPGGHVGPLWSIHRKADAVGYFDGED